MKVKFRFIGDGSEFHYGIPGRDLTEEDWAQLTKEQQATVENSKLYEPVKGRDEAKKEPKGGSV